MSTLILGIVLLLAACGMYLVMNENHVRFAAFAEKYTYTLAMSALAFAGVVATIWGMILVF